MIRPNRAINKPAYDIAIVGAGAAGICAAWAAAQSRTVLLIDASARLGGAVTAAMHRSICGLYADVPRNALDTLNADAQRDLISRIAAIAPMQTVPKQLGKAWVLEFPAPAWDSALQQMCDESSADVQLGVRATAVRRDGNRITALQIEGQNPNWIDVKAIIDCTGGGNLLQLAGQEAYQPADESTAKTLGGFAARLSNIAGDPELLRLQIPFALAKAVQGGELPNVARFTAFHPGPGPGEGVCKLAVNPSQYSEKSASDLLDQIMKVLAAEVPALSAVKILEKSPRVLPRAGLRLAGRFVVTEDDVTSARRHPGGAVHAWWPIEKWIEDQGPTYLYPPQGRHYDIPPDALRSATIENLLAAGACLSATSDAMASIRVSGICMATGAAAGRLAASIV
jgi:glycine/D-amino acid oxidase-like deaminating enzyme